MLLVFPNILYCFLLSIVYMKESEILQNCEVLIVCQKFFTSFIVGK